LPKDEKVTTIDQSFVPAFAAKSEPPTAAEWPRLRDDWMQALRRDCFRAWPERETARMITVCQSTPRRIAPDQNRF